MKKTIAVILESLPVIAAFISFFSIKLSPSGSHFYKILGEITILLALFGFAFFIIGRKLAKEDKAVCILGIMDILSTVYVIVYYILVFLALGSG